MQELLVAGEVVGLFDKEEREAIINHLAEEAIQPEIQQRTEDELWQTFVKVLYTTLTCTTARNIKLYFLFTSESEAQLALGPVLQSVQSPAL